MQEASQRFATRSQAQREKTVTPPTKKPDANIEMLQAAKYWIVVTANLLCRLRQKDSPKPLREYSTTSKTS